MQVLSTLNYKEIDWQNLLKKTGFILLVLFYLNSLISKSGVNIFGGLVLLISFIYILFYKKDIIKNNNFLLILLLPYVLGFLLSFFSLSGLQGGLAFLNRYKFILMLIPLTAFIEDKKNLDYLFAALVVSAAIASLYAFYMYITKNDFRSFLVVGRYGDMLVVVILLNIVFYFFNGFRNEKKHKIINIANLMLIGFFILCLILNFNRGSWLGFFFGIVLFALIYNKKLLILIIIGLLSITIMPNKYTFKKDIISIIDTSNNYSNNVRLNLWKAGIDFAPKYLFFGTGAKNAMEPFKKYLLSKHKDYQEKYQLAMEFSGNFHNSYLQIIIEAGIIYFLMYLISLFYILIKILKNSRKVKHEERRYIITAVISTIGFFIPQFFHGELYSYGMNVYYLTLFGGCFAINKYIYWFRRN